MPTDFETFTAKGIVMTAPSRRSFIAAAGATLGASGIAVAAPSDSSAVEDDLSRYIGFGGKASGGAGEFEEESD